MLKYKSRKYRILWLSMILFSLMPLIYAKFGVSEAIQLTVLGCYASVVFGYNIANLIDKKITGDKDA